MCETPGSRPYMVGIAGGSAAGKTTLCRELRGLFEGRMAVVSQDRYYRDRSHLDSEARRRINYDHPEAFDVALFRLHLQRLRAAQPVPCPIYDFETHTRRASTEVIRPCPIVVVEGLFPYGLEGCERLFDFRVYVEAPADLRLIRRLERDVVERGRDLRGIVGQWLRTVRPMHALYVEACRERADFIVRGDHPVGREARALTRVLRRGMEPTGPASG